MSELRLSLYRFERGVRMTNADCVVYDLERGVAAFGEASVTGPAVVWQLERDDSAHGGALLSCPVSLEPSLSWIVRCDRVDFPPGGGAARHTHPGPGIRYLLGGRIEIETGGEAATYEAGDAWFESGPEPVVARASDEEPTSFVRALLLPEAWAGKRTIRYVEPPAEPPSQTATVLLERPLSVPP